MATLLEHITNVANKAGYQVDTVAIGSTDVTTIQLVAWAQDISREMARKYEWPKLWKSYTFTVAVGQSTYPLPGDFSHYHHDTFWNQSSAYRIFGPMSPQDYAAYKGSNFNPPRGRFTIQGVTDNEFRLYPATFMEGDTLIYEYQSARSVRPVKWADMPTITSGLQVDGKYYCFNNGNYYYTTGTGTKGATAPTHTTGSVSDGSLTWVYYDGTYERFLFDTDEPVLPEIPFERGIFEAFAGLKGLEFEQQFNKMVDEYYALAYSGRVVMMDRPSARKMSAFNGKVAFGRWYE